MRKGEIIIKILEAVKDYAIEQISLVEGILRAGYGASQTKIQYEAFRAYLRLKLGKNYLKDLEKRKKVRNNLRSLISKLKKEGLIQESKDKKIFLTNKGKEKLEKLKSMLPIKKYKAKQSKDFIVITFDIPEKERSKRNWLRRKLMELNMKMLQKSVWIGKITLPKEFISDLDYYRISPYVEIFKISKSGTIQKI